MKKSPPLLPVVIGPYSITRSLGSGGMGEVFLAKDPVWDRELAIKRIRPDLKKNKTLLQRFLREAKVASRLTHPSIIPILSIQNEVPDVYYTMPYVEGETLRQILRDTAELEKTGPLKGHPIGSSIPALARIFLQVCEAIAYTHSKGILHRDLKPENIIVGKYGEVMLLDWGIADFISSLENESSKENAAYDQEDSEDLTRPGKITGTLAYMAPERLSENNPSSVQADIYALGVTLYYMLTLQLPFQRKSLVAFRKNAARERFIDPLEMAPYRDIPHQLASICKKCLSFMPSQRYATVEVLLSEIKRYIEGQAQWIHMASLQPKRKEDWQFQENVLLTKHVAISRSFDQTDWAALMVSRQNFGANLQMEVQVRLQKKSQGIGLLFSIPSAEEYKRLDEGYYLWLEKNSCALFRNHIPIYRVPLGLKEEEWGCIRIQKVEDSLQVYLNDQRLLSYTSHLPMAGSRIGFLYKDTGFDIESIEVYDISHNAQIRCLALPNAFLNHKLYDLAIQEYRRISQSFPGCQEGRDALFRAGVGFLEKGKAETQKQEREQCFNSALKEFEKLCRTPGAPLEYLGKSLVYNALSDAEEEAKCLELALRKFPKHPLLSVLKEHIVYRMHESSQTMRESAFRIILLSIRHIPNVLENLDTRSLIESLEKNLEPLCFIEEVSSEGWIPQIAIQLAFWLAKPLMLGEIASQLAKKASPFSTLIENSLFSLLELEAKNELQKQLLSLGDHVFSPGGKELLQSALADKIPTLDPALPSRKRARVLFYLLRKALIKRQFSTVQTLIPIIQNHTWNPNDQELFDSFIAWFYLLQNKLEPAACILNQYPVETLNKETSPLFFAQSCLLYITQGVEVAHAHFSHILDIPYPWTTALPSYFLLGRTEGKEGWMERRFWWEKKELHRHLDLFYHAIGNSKS